MKADELVAGVQAVILAAGQSKRMGSPKPFLQLGDSTFIEYQLARLAEAGLGPALVVVNPEHLALYEGRNLRGAVLVQNNRVEEGMFYSLRLAMRQTPPLAHHAMVCLADMPLIQANTYRRLAEAGRASRGRIVIAAHGGQAGHPVLWPRSLLAVVAHWSEPDGARGVLSAHEDLVEEVNLPDPAVLRDFDTPEEYARLREASAHFSSANHEKRTENQDQ